MLRAAPSLAGAVWRKALDLVFPPRCVGCGSFDAFICARCLDASPRAEPPRCRVCWMPDEHSVCYRCSIQPFAFEEARAAFIYRGAAREAIHALKYRGLSAIAGVMAKEMASCLERWPLPAVALTPVPITGSRRRVRGYNQSEALARELSRLTGLPLDAGLLARRRGGAPQARAVDEAARRANVEGAFEARQVDADGAPVLLVDDVMTSGATLDACARALRDAGYGPVYALTFARD